MRIYKEELLIWRALYEAECRRQNKEPIEIGKWITELKANGVEIIGSRV